MFTDKKSSPSVREANVLKVVVVHLNYNADYHFHHYIIISNITAFRIAFELQFLFCYLPMLRKHYSILHCYIEGDIVRNNIFPQKTTHL